MATYVEKAKILPNPEVIREQCVEECIGCKKMYSDENVGDVCIAYIDPKISHRNGGCALKSNKEILSESGKKVNPLKASRRMKNRGY